MTVHWYQCNMCKLFRKKEMWKFSFSKSAMEISEQCVKSEVFQYWWSCNLVVKLLVVKFLKVATIYNLPPPPPHPPTSSTFIKGIGPTSSNLAVREGGFFALTQNSF